MIGTGTSSMRAVWGSRRRHARIGAAAVALTMGLAACSPSGEPSASSSTSKVVGAATSAAAGASASGGLEELYRQKLKWTSCDVGECAWLRVPVDYAKPSGPTVNLAVNRVKATGARKGSLVVNPGGPGGSGVDYAAAATQIVSPAVAQNFDIVGFDPRGVQRSAAIRCVSDSDMDELIGTDPSPENSDEEQKLLDENASFARACKSSAGPLLGHVSTREVARDLDVLRAALGEEKLNFLGKSYGTMIGQTYADLFAPHVGKMVLDGVLPSDLSQQDIALGQAKGFETALDAYLADCAKQSSCPVGTDPKAGKVKLKDWLSSVDDKGVAVKGDSRINRLTEGWAVYGVAEALYDQGSWPSLTSALSKAFKGDGSELMQSANRYAQRNSDGTYTGNMMQVINAVNCLDRPGLSGGASAYEKEVERFEKASPTWGSMLAWASSTCTSWPVKPVDSAHPVKAERAGPILVVGTTRDPATPVEWAERVAKNFADGRLLTWDGDGHTAYTRGSTCVDQAVDNYLLGRSEPPKKAEC